MPLNRFVPRLRTLNIGTVEKQGIVEAETTVGGAGEIRAHHDLAGDVGAEGGSGGGDEVVYVFDDVDVDFVAAVLDVAAAVRHCSRRLVRYPRRVFSLHSISVRVWGLGYDCAFGLD